MPNALVVFYSLDGDVRLLARTLAKEIELDAMELELVKPHPTHGFMKYFKGGFLAAIGATPPLRPLAYDAAHYDLIFVGTPVWNLSLIHISEPTRLGMISYAVFCLNTKK